MGSKYQNLLRDTFGGTFSHELLAEGGKHSERKEQFYFISLDISKGNLLDSLSLYVEDEKVDYTWESSNSTGHSVKESLSTTKRISIVSAPKHLILHLKRFSFDFETMTQVKLNNRYEFPVDLNIFPFTKQHRMVSENDDDTLEDKEDSLYTETSVEGRSHMLQENDCNYTLAGVVVHTGTANSGHYYSFIKERGCFSSSEVSAPIDSHGAWFEFNDSFVTEFDSKLLDNEAFGGVIDGSGSKAKVKNAFMLVYDRVTVTPSLLHEDRATETLTMSRANRFVATMQDLILSFHTVSERYTCVPDVIISRGLSRHCLQSREVRL